ncbi:MAG TPA: ABC transporter permease [Mucilaginibacter sp.]|jgi:putative ABC transport system permease protein
MIKNYFKTAWRNLVKNKFYSAINIIGLTVGLTVGLLILLWVNDELSFDKFHTKAGNIYRVEAQMGTGANAQISNDVSAPISVYALKEIPGVESSVRMVSNEDYALFKYGDKTLVPRDNTIFYTDPTIFKVFDFKLLKGNVNDPFPNLQSIIITPTIAKRFFGNTDPIGKVIKADNHDNYTVAGVVADMPENSSIKFDMLFSIEIKKRQYDNNGYWKTMGADWGDYFASTYILLRPGVFPDAVTNLLTQLYHKDQPGSAASKVKFLAQPLTRIHLYNADGTPSGMQTVRIFLIVAALILLIACINYVNLSTARAILRSKEVSIRKIIGAGKKQLFIQFVLETMLFFVVALILSFILIALLMPLYNNLSGKKLDFNLLDTGIWKVIGVTIVSTLVVSSIYPALLLSSFKPVNALKGKVSLGVGNATFRRTLVVIQFIFSVGLIISTLVINNQLKYIRKKDLGYDKSYVFDFIMRDMQKNYEAIRSQLLTQPGVIDVASGSDNIINITNSTSDTQWEGKDPNESFIIHSTYVDKYFMPFFKLKFVAGGPFIGIKSDSAHFILNETAIREAGIINPIGKRFKLNNRNGTIIGVVKDFHFASLRQKIEPAIFGYGTQMPEMFVRTTGKDAPLAVAAVQKVFKQYNPGFLMDYSFVDRDYNSMYKADQQSGLLFSWFAGIAILVSCLGLFGLATYTAHGRIKEIGIRKVLGASVSNITGMLSKDFMALVSISIIIATPIAWYAMNQWLQDFAYRIAIEWWVFALAAIIALLIAFATISYQSIKAALANPVKSLRSD